MQADLDAMENSAQDLARRVAPDFVSRSPGDIVLELVQRLTLAKQAETTFADWQSKLRKSRDLLANAQQKREAVQAKLAPFFTASGVEDVKTLALVIERSDKRREMEREISRTVDNLNQGADGLALEQLQAEAQSVCAFH